MGNYRGTTTNTGKCRMEKNGNKCGKISYNTIECTVEIMEKSVKVKLPICRDCLDSHSDDLDAFSLGGKK